MLFSRGSRAMETLRKLPTEAPTRNTKIRKNASAMRAIQGDRASVLAVYGSAHEKPPATLPVTSGVGCKQSRSETAPERAAEDTGLIARIPHVLAEDSRIAERLVRQGIHLALVHLPG